jgi:hypothetical protein
MNSQNSKNINDQLAQFSGSECIYKHPFGFVYTEGIQYLAESFECYWLIQDIFIHSKSKQVFAQETFQTWKLQRINNSGTAFTLTAEDGNYNKLFQARVPYSDFKGNEVTIWFIEGTMLLPSEY